MGVTTDTTTTITCDNPGHVKNPPGLDPASRDGWTFLTVEVYGAPVVNVVCCSSACAAAWFGAPDTALTAALTVAA